MKRTPPSGGASLRGAVLAAACLACAAQQPASAGPPPPAERLAQAAVAAGDNQSQPFAVIDKTAARLYLFDRDGRMTASSPVLLGLARGDDSVPGIGSRPMADIRAEERTTPAGRFDAEPGINTSGEDITWVDYDAAISMHRVRANNKSERRLQRLASATTSDNRISYGCINVPAVFYDAHVKPTFASRGRAVYVLPEMTTLEARFPFARKSGN
ncbi:L,D-transpeptidase [Acidovorax cavernicola]|uniref:L,D-transpeptidase n=1 Tax=Acidovorax cavernicola TaxID=1675792 RepID=UPI002570F2BA|nr:L,D-transpeptidase [Acidovorax cavernicola]